MSKIKILRILHRASVSGPTHHAAILQKYFNNENFESAIANLTESISSSHPAGNSLYSRLKTNKQYDPIDWTFYGSPSFKMDFLTNFYGDSEDDLINAGITYKKL